MFDLHVTKRDGTRRPFLMDTIHNHTEYACQGLENVCQSELETDAHIQFYDGIPTAHIHRLLTITAAEKISFERPNWTYVAARLTLLTIYKEVTGGEVRYPHLSSYIKKGIDSNNLDPRLGTDFDLDALNRVIDEESDLGFTYMGISTLQARYLVRDVEGLVGPANAILEMPQHFFMRVAMGLALAEKQEDRTKWAIDFYKILSGRKFLNSTPTLFNAGTLRPQLSSCFLLSMGDDTNDIFETLREAAQYSKHSGGIGMDFSDIRPSGSYVAGTKGKAGGTIPYMRLLNVGMEGFDQGGKRQGSASPYLADWHGDFESYLEILSHTKDHRQTAPDLYPACWLSDVFLNRVESGDGFSSFSPRDVPTLNRTYGQAFEAAYTQAEREGKALKVTPAATLFRKYITKRFESGLFFSGFKDTINHRNPMKDAGMVRSSNLCTEITLRTEPTELSAVCNLGSVILTNIDSVEELHEVVRIGVRMLDNVIEIGLIPDQRGKKHNQQERPIGLGVMGYADWLYKQGIKFSSEQHLYAANALMREISYAAIDASADLAQERGAFPLFHMSEWAKGRLTHDTANEEAVSLVGGWDNVGYGDREEALREKIKKGMRNSHLLAIAPTATIANISGVSATIELPLMKEYAKTNLGGTYDVIATTGKYVDDPDSIETSRTVDQNWIIDSAAVRQIWIDQAQSINVYMPLDRQVKGSEIGQWHLNAWKKGLKTLYYLRGITKEEAGLDTPRVEETPREDEIEPEVQLCSIDNPDCESCQ